MKANHNFLKTVLIGLLTYILVTLFNAWLFDTEINLLDYIWILIIGTIWGIWDYYALKDWLKFTKPSRQKSEIKTK